MALRSPVTASPVLAGFDPGDTVTVSSVLFSTRRLLGVATPTPVGDVETADTVTAIEALPLRIGVPGVVSAIVAGSVLRPALVDPATVPRNEKIWSPPT